MESPIEIVSDNIQEVQTDDRVLDMKEKEKEKVDEYLSDGCGCERNRHTLFTQDRMLEMRADCAELDRDQLDLFVMGHLLGSVRDCNNTMGKGHTPHSRVRKSCKFFYKGHQVEI